MILDKDEIVKEYLPLVARLAREIKSNLPNNIEVDDLIQEGVIALIQSVDRYDPRYGTTFKTYAYTRIKGSMIDYLRRLDYLPKNVRQEIKRLDKEIFDFYGKNQRLPSYDELAEMMELTVEEVKELYNDLVLKQYLNLDQYIFDTDNDRFIEPQIESDDNVKEKAWKSILYERLKEAITKLSEKEQMVLSLRFEYDLSLKEIAKVLDVTDSRVSQILSVIFAKLRKYMEE